MHDAVTQNGAVRAHHFRDRQGCCDLNRRDAGLLQFRRDRSAAARAGASRRSEYDGIDSQLFHPFGHLPAHPSRVRERIGQS